MPRDAAGDSATASEAGVAGFLFACVSAALYWPVLAAPGSVAIPTGDVYGNVWALDWVVSHLLRPAQLFGANMFHPDPQSLAYTESLLAQAFQALPFALLGATPLASYNAVWLLTHPLCALGAFLLARELGASRIGGLIAGAGYAFSAYRLASAVHLQSLSLQWLPLTLLCLLRFSRGPSWLRALAVAGFALLQTLSSGYYAALVAVALLASAPLLTGLGRRAWLQLTAALALAAVLAAPALLPYWRLQSDLGLERGRDEAIHWSARPASLLTPGIYAWSPTSAPARRWFASRYALFPGALLLGLALVGLLRGAAGSRRLWLGLLALVGLLLALGPQLQLFGWSLPGPFEALRRLPGWAMLRTPFRLASLYTLALALLAGLGWTWLEGRLRPALRWGLLLLVAAELLPFGTWQALRPMPQPPAWVEWLTAAPAGVVLELPLRGAEDGLALYWSLLHRQRLVNGWGAFASPTSQRLGAIGNRWPFAWASRVMRRYGVRYVVVDAARWPQRRRERLERVALPQGVRLEAVFGAVHVYSLSAEGELAKLAGEQADPVLKRLERVRPGASRGPILAPSALR